MYIFRQCISFLCSCLCSLASWFLSRKTRFGAYCVKNARLKLLVDTNTAQDILFRVHFLLEEDGCHQIKVAMSIRFIRRDDRRKKWFKFYLCCT